MHPIWRPSSCGPRSPILRIGSLRSSSLDHHLGHLATKSLAAAYPRTLLDVRAPGRRRYALAAGANLAAAAVFTALAAHRLGGRPLSPPNLLTLSRAVPAAMLCGTAFSGLGRRPALWGLLLGCTLCDWMDGPLARRLGPTRLGAVLDLEADSWLTLWAAVAAVRLGRLPAISLLPPSLRYPLTAGRAAPHRRWERAAGVSQMVLVAAALARWRPPPALAGAVAAAQLAALAAGMARRRPA